METRMTNAIAACFCVSFMLIIFVIAMISLLQNKFLIWLFN